MFRNEFVANLQVRLSAKEFWKSVNIWESYWQKFSVSFSLTHDVAAKLVAALLRVARVTAGLAESNGSHTAGFMTHVTCRLAAKNRGQLRKPTLGNPVWATFTFSHGVDGSADFWNSHLARVHSYVQTHSILAPSVLPATRHSTRTYRPCLRAVNMSSVYGYSRSQSNLPHRYGNSHAIIMGSHSVTC